MEEICFEISVDIKEYEKKPSEVSNFEVSSIKARLADPDSVIPSIASGLSWQVQQGRTICPAVLNCPIESDGMRHHKAENFKSQQVFFIDIDNAQKDKQKLPPPDYVSVTRAQQLCEENGIKVLFMYKSFNYKPDYEKFRVVILLDEVITDPNERKQIITNLIELFGKAADHSCTNADRIFFGSTTDCILGEVIEHTTPKSTVLEALWLREKETEKAVVSPPDCVAPKKKFPAWKKDSKQTNDFDFDIDKLLFCLDADAEQPKWISITTAYKGAGGDKQTWERWSRQSSKWKDSDTKTWDGLNGTSRASLITLAGETPQGREYMDSLREAQQHAKKQWAQSTQKNNFAKTSNGKKYTPRRIDEYGDFQCDFLWDPYIPRNEYTILMAESGIGKSTLCDRIAANVTTGRKLFGEIADKEPQRVLIISSEDDGELIKARMSAEEVNSDNLRILDRVDSVGLTLTDDNAFEELIKEFRPALVFVDPWQAYIGAQVNINAVNQVRPILQKISAIAKKYSCAIVLISHVNKQPQCDNANNAAIGSTDFVNAARSVLKIERDDNPYAPDEKDNRLLIHTKSNITALGKTVAFSLADGTVRWQGFSDIDRSVIELAARKKINKYEALALIQENEYDWSDLIEAIVKIRSLYGDEKLEVHYDELEEISPVGDKIWGETKPNQHQNVIKSIISKLTKEHNIRVEFPKNTFRTPRTNKSARGIVIIYIKNDTDI